MQQHQLNSDRTVGPIYSYVITTLFTMADKRLESESKVDLSHTPDKEKAMEGGKDHVFECKRCRPHLAEENAPWNHTRVQHMDEVLEHRCTTSQICIVQAVTTTTLRICQEVETGKLGCTAVRDYTRDTNKEQIATMIIDSLDVNFTSFVNGIKNSFSDIEYA
jgi:hypothetical protein